MFSRVSLVLGDKRGSYLLGAAQSVLIGLLDITVLSMIIPLVSAVVQPKQAIVSPFAFISKYFDFKTQHGLLTASAVLITIIVAKNLYAFCVSWWMTGVVFATQAQLRCRLLALYLLMPYEDVVAEGSVAMTRSLTTDVQMMCDNWLLPGTRVISDGIICIIIALFLFAMNPTVALFGLLFVLATSLSYKKLLSPILGAAGNRVIRANEGLIRNATESMQGVKEIKSYAAQEFIYDSVIKQSGDLARESRKFYTIFSLPRVVLEAVVMAMLAGASAVIILLNKDVSYLLALLAVFAASGLRILPAASQVMAGISSISFGRPAFRRIYEALNQARYSDYVLPDLHNTHILRRQFEEEFRSLDVVNGSFRFKATQDNAIDDVNFGIRRKQFVGMVGRSGSGKTTLVDAMLGLYPLDAGEVKLNGSAVRGADFESKIWPYVSYVQQHTFMFDASLEENVVLGSAGKVDTDRLREIIDDLELTHLVDRGNVSLGEMGKGLSGGERQRIGLARALYADRPVLVLDEATSSLDVATERRILEKILHKYRPVVMVAIAHRLDTLRSCDVVVEFSNGRQVRIGPPGSMLGT